MNSKHLTILCCIVGVILFCACQYEIFSGHTYPAEIALIAQLSFNVCGIASAFLHYRKWKQEHPPVVVYLWDGELDE